MTKKFTPPPIRHPFERVRVFSPSHGDSITHQAHKANCDISNIMRRYDNTGLLPDGRAGSYVDCTGYQGKTRAELIMQAREQVSQAEKAHSSATAKQKKAAKEKAASDKAELEQLRAEKKKASMPSSSDEPQN